MSKNSVHLKVKDHSVSGEFFQLIPNPEFGFLETSPKPEDEKLPEYYESEDYISHTNAKRNWFENIYHWVRTISLKLKLKLIHSYSTEAKNLLDVGCGTGDFLETAFKANWNITGIEPNPQARKIANIKTNSAVLDSDRLFQLQEKSFDVITLWHVLEHLPNLESHMALFKKLLKPQGVLIVAVPNPNSFDAKYYKAFWAAYDVPRHLWHFNRTAMQRLANAFHFKIVKVKPMWFDAFYVSLLSEKHKTGSMNVFKGFAVGLCSNMKALVSKEASSLIYVLKNTKNTL